MLAEEIPVEETKISLYKQQQFLVDNEYPLMVIAMGFMPI